MKTIGQLNHQATEARHFLLMILVVLLTLVLVACNGAAGGTPTPTVDPDIFNQVPDTTVFEPGQCVAVLEAPAAAYTSSTLGSAPSGEMPAGEYEVGVAADYGSSLWYGLNGVEGPNYINSDDVSSLAGDCTVDSQ